jgi:hypothetical protein
MEQSMDITATLNQAILAVKAGRKAEARRLLESVLDADERNEQAWLWLSGVLDDVEDRTICLENVLTINPDNQVARQGLAALRATPETGRPAPPGAPTAAREPSPMAGEPQAPAAQPGLPVEAPARGAPPGAPIADHRPFIVITIVLVLLLICTVVSILIFVSLPPVG